MFIGNTVYHKGRVVKQLDKETWIFEVEGKLYKNRLQICLDNPVELSVGVEFEISDLALEASDLI